jgi:long-chain acyl-CoA synthetase
MVMAQSYLLDVNPVAPDDVILHAAPVTHGSGLCMFHHLAHGAANAFPDTRRFEPREIFATIQKYRVTTLFLAPTMINMLVASDARQNFDLSSLHTVIYGGGPMYAEHLVEAVRTFGPIFVQIFGQGEAPMAITTLPIAEHRIDGDQVAIQRLASAGRAITGVRVSVVDEQDRELPAGETGEIVVRGDLVMKGYWNNAAATADTLRNGWLHTGDLGNLDSDGYLYITDRIKDMIISGGANVYPREVEEVIATHPAVDDVAVIGVPHEKWGETVKALIVLNGDAAATAEDILDFCRTNLADYKKPTTVEFLPDLPKNAYGKVLKRELRERYWSSTERRI